jgi:NADH-quinone oxidoreductase subunit L
MTPAPHAIRVVTETAPWLFLLPGLPLAAFTMLILWGRRLGRASAWVSVGALVGAFVLTCSIGSQIAQGARFVAAWPWLSHEASRWTLGLAVDGLSWLMLIVVTAIGTMIQLYSIGYMHGDPRFSRFFAYLSLFCASMLLLVLADHFVVLYAGWELVGLCSYLLISFWFEKPAAAAAGRKAFLTTRVGDAGLLLGILLLAWTAGDLSFGSLGATHARFVTGGREGLLTAISLLVFLGAVGKSAQIPLHVWLPDAMEGPTPVSALIHAATMVAAGVYLVARAMPLFTPESLQVVLEVGLLTHLLAGTVALTQTDIKRVLAYSTVSQLGLMFTALGLGATAVGMFHLFTHAFFKALLFLGAGSVIHATHQQELDRLGGLRRAMPWTWGLVGIATLAACGIFPFSGFWSKDAILIAAGESRPGAQWLVSAGAVVTAAYMTRLFLRCFHGAPAGDGHGGHGPHESPAVMVLPMAVLALGAAVAGFAGSPWAHNPLFRLLGAHGHEHLDVGMAVTSTLIAGLGIALGWLVGFRRAVLVPAPLRGVGHRLYLLAAAKYRVDEAYERFLLQPLARAAGALARFDQRRVDGAVDGAGRLGWWAGQWKARIDQRVVDGAVNALAAGVRQGGAVLRLLQTGIVQQYLLLLVASVVVLTVWVRL